MLRNVFGKTLWDQRRGIVVWSLGIAAVGVMYAAFYPSINNPDMAAALDAYPEGLLDALGMTDITSPSGYIGGTTYGLLGPVLVIIFATVLGSRAIAGEEEAGRLDVLLAHPVDRSQVVVQQAAALVVALAAAGIVLLAAMAAAAGPAQYADIGIGNLAAATLQLVLLGTFFGTLALAVGAVTGRRGLSLATVAIIGIGTYFANTLAPSVEAIAWSRDLSPFRYYSGGQPLVNGWQPVDGLILLLAGVVLVAIGVVGFRRRDVAT
jgi:ABC-2 type transport system permease protein